MKCRTGAVGECTRKNIELIGLEPDEQYSGMCGGTSLA